MKSTIATTIAVIASMVMATSCSDFLKEDPKTFISPANYYTNATQMETAANGLYEGLGTLEQGAIVFGSMPLHFLEYMTGYVERKCTNLNQANEALFLRVTEDNYLTGTIWTNSYVSIENCNSLIAGIEASTADVAEAVKNQYLGEGYFFRAYYYFNLVRLFGPVPLKITPTTGLADSKLPLTDEATVFAQIAADLETAEGLLSDWVAGGRIGKGAAKSLLADVYLTMAGSPVNDATYYQKAYAKALEVVNCGKYYLNGTFESARAAFNKIDGGEYILSREHLIDVNESAIHGQFIYYDPAATSYVSFNGSAGAAEAPAQEFYDSYEAGDLRVAEQGYYYTHYPAQDGSGEIEFKYPTVFKYWDNAAVNTGKSAVNFPLIRYTDVLLTLAEAACAGGSTNDPAAVKAFVDVRSRALPGFTTETVSFDDVMKERCWEECFEGVLWFDMVRTRKAFDTASGKVVDLIGYKAPAHDGNAFAEKDILMPYPVSEVRLNPNLKR